MCFAKQEQCYHLISTDSETVAVRFLLPLRHIPESYSIVCIYVKQHQTLPIFNLVFAPMTDMLFLLFKNAKDLNITPKGSIVLLKRVHM